MAVNGFSSEAIGVWAREQLPPGSHMPCGLDFFRAVTTAGCIHEAIVIGGKPPSVLLQFRSINTLLGKLKTSFKGTFHAFNFDKYSRCYLGGYSFRFKGRF
jgi:hypothetical protein